jgi:hypothetical protein
VFYIKFPRFKDVEYYKNRAIMSNMVTIKKLMIKVGPGWMEARKRDPNVLLCFSPHPGGPD